MYVQFLIILYQKSILINRRLKFEFQRIKMFEYNLKLKKIVYVVDI